MSDLIARHENMGNGTRFLIEDALDDSEEGRTVLKGFGASYSEAEVIQLLNDLGFNVDDRRDVQF